ncbi:MAG TPA: hypothetical protein VN451_02275 [Chitinophagaceae bacterium]|nr:hypothetical protein [Chitinophagaceae bacterium]
MLAILLNINSDKSLITGLITLLLMVVVFVFLVLPLLRNNKLKKQLLKSGEVAEAIILGFHHTGVNINNCQQVKIQVQVFPEKGRNFITEIMETLHPEELILLKSGSRIKILFNPPNRRQVRLMNTTI